MLQFFGGITPPPGVSRYGDLYPGVGGFISNIIRLLVIVAGLYTFFNLILAGYQFISAGGNPKQVTAAWSQIWQSLVGLIIVAAAFLVAAIIGLVVFQDAGFILKPVIYGPLL
jgi:hypothetical protein